MAAPQQLQMRQFFLSLIPSQEAQINYRSRPRVVIFCDGTGITIERKTSAQPRSERSLPLLARDLRLQQMDLPLDPPTHKTKRARTRYSASTAPEIRQGISSTPNDELHETSGQNSPHATRLRFRINRSLHQDASNSKRMTTIVENSRGVHQIRDSSKRVRFATAISNNVRDSQTTDEESLDKELALREVAAYVQRLLSSAGSAGVHWNDLVRVLNKTPVVRIASVVGILKAVGLVIFDDQQGILFWNRPQQAILSDMKKHLKEYCTVQAFLQELHQIEKEINEYQQQMKRVEKVPESLVSESDADSFLGSEVDNRHSPFVIPQARYYPPVDTPLSPSSSSFESASGFNASRSLEESGTSVSDEELINSFFSPQM